MASWRTCILASSRSHVSLLFAVEYGLLSGMTVSDSLFDAMMRSGGVGMSHGLGGHIRICQFHF